MSTSFSRIAALIGAFLLLGAVSEPKWEVLFDGKGTSQWRSYRGREFPAKGWSVDDEGLRCHSKGGGGDIVTREQYENFELEFEWKVSAGANSGVMYRVREDKGASYETGPEFQVLDDAQHPDGKNPKTSAGSLYALIAANGSKELKAVGQWNQARIMMDGKRVEHWLNGKMVVGYEWGSPELQSMIAKSKFKDWPGFARQTAGHICIQDHGDDVWFRNVRIRRLPTR